jgi:L(+)-tartrate dehydratase beta subunit
MAAPSIDAIEMNRREIDCPCTAEALQSLEFGDLVYLSGPIFTGREGLYRRLIDEKIEFPVSLETLSNVNFHCSPAAVPTDTGYTVKAVTATASFRFGKWMRAFFEKTGCRVIIGKGGMASSDYKELFVPQGAVYLTTVGYGLGATYGRCIEGVRDVYWLEELGIAQAVWVLQCRKLGPFIVESDAQGNSLFELANQKVNENLARLYEGLPQPAMRRYGEELDRSEEVV